MLWATQPIRVAYFYFLCFSALRDAVGYLVTATVLPSPCVALRRLAPNPSSPSRWGMWLKRRVNSSSAAHLTLRAARGRNDDIIFHLGIVQTFLLLLSDLQQAIVYMNTEIIRYRNYITRSNSIYIFFVCIYNDNIFIYNLYQFIIYIYIYIFICI